MFAFVSDVCRQVCVSFLHLLVTHSAFQLTFYLFSSLVKSDLEYRGIQSKKIFYRLSNSSCNPVNCCNKRRFFRSIVLLSKSQQMGILQRLVDKCSHLFICKSLKQTFRYHSKWLLLQYFTLDSFLFTADLATTSSSTK